MSDLKHGSYVPMVIIILIFIFILAIVFEFFYVFFRWLKNNRSTNPYYQEDAWRLEKKEKNCISAFVLILNTITFAKFLRIIKKF